MSFQQCQAQIRQVVLFFGSHVRKKGNLRRYQRDAGSDRAKLSLVGLRNRRLAGGADKQVPHVPGVVRDTMKFTRRYLGPLYLHRAHEARE